MKLDTTIESYLNNLIKPHFNFSTETITEKDSRDISAEDRHRLLKAIQASPHQNVIVTHGTFTMTTTAKYLEEQLHSSNKKVVLTGSMIPISGFSTSDAGFNLGFVAGSLSNIEPGVYLSMNGGIFSATEVAKNEDIFRFE